METVRNCRNRFQKRRLRLYLCEKQKMTLISANKRKRRFGFHAAHEKQILKEQYESYFLNGFTNADVDDLREIFEFYDVDNNKTMDLTELDKALRALGYNPTIDEVEEMIAMMDIDGDKSIDFSEFCMIVGHMTEKKDEFSDLREALRCVERNEDGVVKEEDLFKLMSVQSDGMSIKEIENMLKVVAKDGVIDCEEFIRIIKKAQEKNLADDFTTSKSNETHVPTDTDFRTSTVADKVSSSSIKKKSKTTASKKKKNGGKVNLPDKPCNVETIDSILKALGGPILLTSAIIITSSASKTKPRQKKSRWPSVKRILSYKIQEEKKKAQEMSNLRDVSIVNEATGLLSGRAVAEKVHTKANLQFISLV
ncbi:unnamed protein product [Clavelina lepadiformis]|uniref:EF-hand domain-containing protein n=1 Tax=Clavelina lepadiformis TaxID=159417 RepID=A0ABP0EZ99_CLALP